MKFKFFFFSLLILISSFCFATEKTTIRLGVLAFGTVNWELETLKNQHLLDNANFQLEIRPVANPQAGKIALQSGAVDMIVSDWVWVSRLRSTGSDFTFYPYSTTSGALVVPKNSPIKSLADLKNTKLGIAGGELDKNWLLLQALSKQNQTDLISSIEKTYGAPPLLNQQIRRNRVDAIITYWHYAAKLEAAGYRRIISGNDIMHQLGIKEELPTLGYVFSQHWANNNKSIINEFFSITKKAKDQLCQSDKIWQQIIPLTKVKDNATQAILRDRYCQGRIKQWGKTEQQAATKIYTFLRQLSNNKLTGNSETLQPGTFWTMD
ncbi:MAG: ABC transporter substrate-binding protein [Methylococcales bacterium]|nr:ABC transporter substrate-binding protein [Methylococcales bacterium]